MFKKRAVITLSVAVLLAVATGICVRAGVSPVSNAVNTVMTPVGSALVRVCRPVKNFVSFVSEMKDLKAENELLKSELAMLEKENKSKEEYKKENTRLKKLLNLTEEIESCETVAARIASFEPGNWFYSIVINKGSKDGIKKADTVICESGLVGKVSETGYNWARVSTILDPNNAVGIRIVRNGVPGIVEGDSELLKEKRLKLGYIAGNASPVNGDLLETSGLGGVYPPGVSVGTVEEAELDGTGELAKGIIKPSADFENLYEVIVITSWTDKIYDKDRVTAEYAAETSVESGRSEKSLKQKPVEDENEPEENEEASEAEDEND